LKTVVLSVAEFFYDDLRTKDFSLEERKLISDWRNLSPEMKKAVTAMIAAAQAEAKELSQTKKCDRTMKYAWSRTRIVWSATLMF